MISAPHDLQGRERGIVFELQMCPIGPYLTPGNLCSEVGEAHETEQATCQTDDQTAVVHINLFYTSFLYSEMLAMFLQGYLQLHCLLFYPQLHLNRI